MLENNLNHDPTAALKAAFRRHASGVAVITTKSETGDPVGFTATSMTSLGSNPALVTFNVSRSSSSWDALSRATHVALHILGSENLELARKMAEDQTKRFADADWDLKEAADAMAKGGFRHLVVVENGQVAGIISMRDIIHVWRPR